MIYKYKNMKHVVLHGIKPGETKEFDHPILGGGILLIKEQKTEKEKCKVCNGTNVHYKAGCLDCKEKKSVKNNKEMI